MSIRLRSMVGAFLVAAFAGAAWLSCASRPPGEVPKPAAPAASTVSVPPVPATAPSTTSDPSTTSAATAAADDTGVQICDHPGPPPAASAPEEQKILHAICPLGIDPPHLPDRPGYACRCCAPFGCCDAEAPSDPVTERYALRSIVHGSFTASGAKEALAVIWGCEPYSGNYGGSVLLRDKGTSWEMVRYHSGYNPDHCDAVRGKDGRDVLVCQWTTGKMVRSFFVYALTLDDKGEIARGPETDGHLFQIDDNTGDMCLGDEQVRMASTEGVALKDLNGDGWIDLTVTASMLDFKPSKAQRDDLCEPTPPATKKRKVAWPKAPQYKIDYFFDGESFTVAPKSAAVQKRLTGE